MTLQSWRGFVVPSTDPLFLSIVAVHVLLGSGSAATAGNNSEDISADDGLLQDLRTSRLLFQRLIKIQHRLRRSGLPEPEQRLLLHRTRKIAAHHRNQRLVGRVLEL